MANFRWLGRTPVGRRCCLETQAVHFLPAPKNVFNILYMHIFSVSLNIAIYRIYIFKCFARRHRHCHTISTKEEKVNEQIEEQTTIRSTVKEMQKQNKTKKQSLKKEEEEDEEN